jgi:hypothetical protein
VIGRVAHGMIVLGDEELLEIHALAQMGLKLMRERNGIFAVQPSMQALSQIAKEIATSMSMSGRELRTSQMIGAESLPSSDRDLPQELTVRQAVPLLPFWSERHIRRLVQTGELPILRRDPILLDRDMVLAVAARAPRSRGAAA